MASALFDSLCLSRLIKGSFEHLVGNKYTMYVLCWKIYRKASFSTFSQWVQINYIFTDNVRILCLSCNVKKSKTTGKLSRNCRNKCCCNTVVSNHVNSDHVPPFSCHDSWNVRQTTSGVYTIIVTTSTYHSRRCGRL